jgi:hypothetical protein
MYSVTSVYRIAQCIIVSYRMRTALTAIIGRLQISNVRVLHGIVPAPFLKFFTTDFSLRSCNITLSFVNVVSLTSAVVNLTPSHNVHNITKLRCAATYAVIHIWCYASVVDDDLPMLIMSIERPKLCHIRTGIFSSPTASSQPVGG